MTDKEAFDRLAQYSGGREKALQIIQQFIHESGFDQAVNAMALLYKLRGETVPDEFKDWKDYLYQAFRYAQTQMQN